MSNALRNSLLITHYSLLIHSSLIYSSFIIHHSSFIYSSTHHPSDSPNLRRIAPHPFRWSSIFASGSPRCVSVSSVPPSTSRSSIVTIVGRFDVAFEIQVNDSRDGRSISRYSPQ